MLMFYNKDKRELGRSNQLSPRLMGYQSPKEKLVDSNARPWATIYTLFSLSFTPFIVCDLQLVALLLLHLQFSSAFLTRNTLFSFLCNCKLWFQHRLMPPISFLCNSSLSCGTKQCKMGFWRAAKLCMNIVCAELRWYFEFHASLDRNIIVDHVPWIGQTWASSVVYVWLYE